jgi:hypothetical protein
MKVKKDINSIKNSPIKTPEEYANIHMEKRKHAKF